MYIFCIYSLSNFAAIAAMYNVSLHVSFKGLNFMKKASFGISVPQLPDISRSIQDTVHQYQTLVLIIYCQLIVCLIRSVHCTYLAPPSHLLCLPVLPYCYHHHNYQMSLRQMQYGLSHICQHNKK